MCLLGLLHASWPIWLTHVHVQALAMLQQRMPTRPCLLVLDDVYGPDLPDEEVSAAVGADTLSAGAETSYGSDAGRVLRTQVACRLSAVVQQRILLDVFRLRPQSLPAPAFFDALCEMQVHRLCQCSV